MMLEKTVRRLLELYYRNSVVVRNLPEQFESRRIVVSPDASLRYLRPGAAGFDPILFRLAERYVTSDSVCWDIGANIGAFAFPAAVRARNGRVLAIEPDPFLCSLLRRTIAMKANLDLRVDVLPIAVSDRCGLTTLTLASRGRAVNSIARAHASTQQGGERASIVVPTLTLDGLIADYPAPSLLKIDVEGAEHLVLEGAACMLRNVRPIIIVEVSAENEAVVRRALNENAYRLYDAYTGSDTPIEACAYNTLAIPAEREGV